VDCEKWRLKSSRLVGEWGVQETKGGRVTNYIIQHAPPEKGKEKGSGHKDLLKKKREKKKSMDISSSSNNGEMAKEKGGKE